MQAYTTTGISIPSCTSRAYHRLVAVVPLLADSIFLSIASRAQMIEHLPFTKGLLDVYPQDPRRRSRSRLRKTHGNPRSFTNHFRRIWKTSVVLLIQHLSLMDEYSTTDLPGFAYGFDARKAVAEGQTPSSRARKTTSKSSGMYEAEWGH